jgi:hypothetical protein
MNYFRLFFVIVINFFPDRAVADMGISLRHVVGASENKGIDEDQIFIQA